MYTPSFKVQSFQILNLKGLIHLKYFPVYYLWLRMFSSYWCVNSLQGLALVSTDPEICINLLPLGIKKWVSICI